LWHVVVDFIVLDMKKRIAGLLIAMENYWHWVSLLPFT
jgi:hypothetical protein